MLCTCICMLLDVGFIILYNKEFSTNSQMKVELNYKWSNVFNIQQIEISTQIYKTQHHHDQYSSCMSVDKAT